MSESKIPLEDLELFWRGRAQALRMLQSKAKVPNDATLATAETYETCAREIRTALSKANGETK